MTKIITPAQLKELEVKINREIFNEVDDLIREAKFKIGKEMGLDERTLHSTFEEIKLNFDPVYYNELEEEYS